MIKRETSKRMMTMMMTISSERIESVNHLPLSDDDDDL